MVGAHCDDGRGKKYIQYFNAVRNTGKNEKEMDR
jgi:hypothetical protein